jgi:hypothetical protein
MKQFSHQTKFSDGEVYRIIRYYQDQEDVIQDLLLTLSNGKQDGICRLLKDEDLVRAFDRLLPFRALWIGLQLGNIRNLLALHCVELTFSYLTLIYSTWDQITLGNAAIQQAVDIQDVRNLQRRAPSASTLDRQYIIHEMDNGTLFSAIVDSNLRDAIKRAILGLEVIIPTIETFHDNIKYLSIGAKIIRTLLLGKERVTTLYKSLRSHWLLPSVILEEFREMEVILERPEAAFHFCFLQIFVAAFRWFPNLSNSAPLKEPKRKRGSDGSIHASIDTACKLQFWRRAHLLGFRTDVIGGLSEGRVVEVPEFLAEDNSGEAMERRTGTPYTNSYKQFRTQLFLSNLHNARPGPIFNPSVMFVQRDFINAFFGCTRGDGGELVPMIPPIPLFELVPPREVMLSSTVNSFPHESVASPRSARSSEYGQLPPTRASSEVSHGTEGHWSQFSLPSFNESHIEDDNEPLQRGHSLTSLPNSFELRDEDDDRYASPAADLQDSDVWRSASTDRRSFPELEERWLAPESTDEEGGRRSFPILDVEILSAASSSTLRARSFSEPASPDRDMRNEQFPNADLQQIVSIASTGGSARSFPEFDFPAADGDQAGLSPVDFQSSTDSWTERRSFPDVGLPDREPTYDGTCQNSLDTTGVYDEAQGSSPNKKMVSQQLQGRPFVFTEHNGMTKRRKSELDMKGYLERREDWIMMVLRNNVLKTIRFENIVEHMKKLDEEAGRREYFLVKRDYAAHFRKTHMNSRSTNN